MPSNKKVKTLAILQITRIGDLLQTYQAVQGVRSSHPNLRLILIAREKFAKPIEFKLREIFDEIYFVNLANYIDTTSATLDNSVKKINDFVSTINKEEIEVLVNLSFSKSSSYLCSLIKSKNIIGPYYDKLSNIRINDKWSQFIYSNVLGSSLCPFSLVDLYKNIIGIQEDYKFTKKEPKHTNQITIHPFTSHERKNWKPTKWTEIVYKIMKDNPDIKLNIVGASSDINAAEKLLNNPLIERYQQNITNHVGKTSISQLFKIVESSDLFIGHDSMVGHIAAITGTTSITISLGIVRPHETTPYSNNSYSMAPTTPCFPCIPDTQCDFFQCHSDIPYQVVVSSIQEILDTGAITNESLVANNTPFHLNSVNVYKSTFTKQGQQKLKNIIHQEASTQNIFRTLYRISWLYSLAEVEETHDFPSITQKTHAELLNYMKGLQSLFELCEFGKKYSRYILDEISSKEADISKIKEYSNKIDEIDILKGMVLKTHPLLAPFINYFTTVMGNLEGENIVQLTENSYLANHNFTTMISIFYDLIEQSLAEYKIKSNINHQSNQIAK